MKKYFSFLTPVVLSLLFVCCNNDTYRHGFGFDYPRAIDNYTSSLFIDQVKDSVVFKTFDSYAVAAYNTDWIKPNAQFSPAGANIPNSYYAWYQVKVGLDIELNTTGKCRLGYVGVHTFGTEWDETCYAYYFQTNFHCITRPAPKYKYDDNKFIVGATHELTVSATQVSDEIKFVAYSDWKLTLKDGDFVHPDTEEGKGSATGTECVVKLAVDENTSKEDRKATFVLSSPLLGPGIETQITFVQKGVEEKEPAE